FLFVVRVALHKKNAEIETDVGYVRERMAGIDDEGCQYGKYPLLKILSEAVVLLITQFGMRNNPDACPLQTRQNLVNQASGLRSQHRPETLGNKLKLRR